MRSLHYTYNTNRIGTERRAQVRPPSSIFEQYECKYSVQCVEGGGPGGCWVCWRPNTAEAEFLGVIGSKALRVAPLILYTVALFDALGM